MRSQHERKSTGWFLILGVPKNNSYKTIFPGFTWFYYCSIVANTLEQSLKFKVISATSVCHVAFSNTVLL